MEITIPMEEYKELLEIKGKYEILKELYDKKMPTLNPINIRGLDVPIQPYKMTCKIDGKEVSDE